MLDDRRNGKPPRLADQIAHRAEELGFSASCDAQTGSLLRTLIASRPGSRILELGTGAGYSTAWIAEGMDGGSRLTTVELDEACAAVAREILGGDPRIEFAVGDGADFIRTRGSERYDFIFADTWPGKFYLTEEALAMVRPGGIYLIDDLNPQPNWPEGHGSKVEELVAYLDAREDFHLAKMNWATGLILMTRKV